MIRTGRGEGAAPVTGSRRLGTSTKGRVQVTTPTGDRREADPDVPGPALSDLTAAVTGFELRGVPGARITGVAYRSGEVLPGNLFFCVPGTNTDGHAHAREAVDRGAAALVVERWLPISATQVRVPSVRAAMGPLAAEFYGRPAERMTVTGITGTNGKTTTTYLMESVFEAAGGVAAIVGTTGVRIAGKPSPLSHTTPEAPDLHALLKEMADAGVTAVAMEVSSHGLDQHRVGGVRFACSVFTNLSQDHLDYHGTLERYFFAKARLFDPSISEAAAVNIDDESGRRLLRPDLPTTTFGTSVDADVRAQDIRTDWSGIAFKVGDLEVTSSLRGRFNVMNCLGALAASRALGISDSDVVRGIRTLEGVPGRLEPVDEGQDFAVFVDYAHTPDSLENLLAAARPLSSGRTIAVFGCGGDRDRGKRRLMGEVATRLADLTIVTSDNPRSEDPAKIIGEIEPGAKEGRGPYEIEPDRRAAIRRALEAASGGDVVVIAGKGHETGQQFAEETIPFDDRLVAAEELRRLGGGR
jgi:UDP-N-acetylmuramoyl-L-alanyl-D-glutamate--2,6-diaminopimelate ligase